ncbi:MAG: hypothetical protein ACYC3I_21635 [Gemmataceae bacterium]
MDSTRATGPSSQRTAIRFRRRAVHFVANAINLDLYRGLATIQGGEVVDSSPLH